MKLVDESESSIPITSKKKIFSGNTSLPNVKIPKSRQKSSSTILLSSDLAKNSDLNRRVSLPQAEYSKNYEKQNKSCESKVEKNSTKVFGGLPKSSKKQKFNTTEVQITKSHKIKSKFEKHTPLVLAPSIENDHSPLIADRTINANITESLQMHQSKKKKKSKSLISPPPQEKNEGILIPKKKAKTSQNKQKFELDEQKSLGFKTDIAELESQFHIKLEDVETAIKGVIKFASNNQYIKNQLFNEELPIYLQINSFKIPKCSGKIKQVFRVPLKHSVLTSDSDICLIVPDVKGINNNEHEKHLEHYENLMRAKDVTGIKKIMTFHEFRTEYDTFEMKNRLVDLYDLFLVDGRISGKVVHKCGSIFYKKRKVPIAVKLYLPKLKEHIEQNLKKSYFHISLASDSHIVQVGHSKMNTDHLVENVYSVVEFLVKQFPGKMDNIRSLNVYAHRGSSIPIYISLKNPNDIKIPILKAKKPAAYKSYSGELTTQYNAEVLVRPSGEVIVKRRKGTAKEKIENPDDISDADILRENRKLDKVEQESRDEGSTPKKGAKKRKTRESQQNEGVICENLGCNNAEQNVELGQKKKRKKKDDKEIGNGPRELDNQNIEGKIRKVKAGKIMKMKSAKSKRAKKNNIQKIVNSANRKKKIIS